MCDSAQVLPSAASYYTYTTYELTVNTDTAGSERPNIKVTTSVYHRIAHTTALITPVVEHWQEREIAGSEWPNIKVITSV